MHEDSLGKINNFLYFFLNSCIMKEVACRILIKLKTTIKYFLRVGMLVLDEIMKIFVKILKF